MSDKIELYAWACSQLRKHIDADHFGTVTIAFANGKVSGIKEEINRKPPSNPLDAEKRKI